MKRVKAQTWWRVRVRGSREALEDRLPFVAERWGGFQFEEEGDEVKAIFYLSSTEKFEDFQKELRSLGFEIEEDTEIEEEDWGENWKEHFKPLKVSERIWISPPWEKIEVRPGEIVLVIDPGQAFGTGHHPTTALMLGALDVFLGKKRIFSVLDVGTGTGVLALAAAKLGAQRVLALDIDPEALQAAQRNAVSNRVSLEISSVKVEEMEGEFDLILANISAWELKRLAPFMAERLAPGGRLFLSGFLKKEGPEMAEVYLALGLEKIGESSREEWGFLAFLKRSR